MPHRLIVHAGESLFVVKFHGNLLHTFNINQSFQNRLANLQIGYLLKVNDQKKLHLMIGYEDIKKVLKFP